MNKLTLAVLAIGLSVVTLAQAAPPQGRGMGPCGGWMDANQDGQITPSEVKTMRASHFSQMDSNKDGTLSQEEFLAFVPPGMAGGMNRPPMGWRHGMTPWGRPW
ncbi:MAG: EF-hand domain-containing protein [Magnetococcales bacterium]|nr:EF-hand domain-containing protein [Magnetococcales bacterium]NGZ27176.1 EF-hand domain-containing protein [Magnetococcales bacterium]